MKYNLLEEGCPIKVVYGGKRSTPPAVPGKKSQSKEILFPMLKTIIFTDGDVKDVHQKGYHNITNNYTMNGQTYLNVNAIREDKVFLEKYSYVIIVTVAKEWFNGKNVGGWFDVIRDVQVQFKKANDKNAMKEVKRILSMIKVSKFYDYGVMNNLAHNFEFNKSGNDVYTLRKTK